MKSILSLALMLTVSWLAPSAYASTQPKQLNGQTTAGDESVTAEKAQQLTDDKIVAIVIAIDKSEIAAANVAKKKQLNKEVLDYANYLYQHHQENLHQIEKLESTTGLKPLQSETSISMMKQNKIDVKALRALKGVPFQSAYVDAMVKGHAGGLELIDKTLLKEVSNAELRAFLIEFRSMVAEHLKLGIQLQSQLKNQ